MADAASISDVLKSIPEIVKIIPDQDKLAALTVVALLVIVLVLFQSRLLSFTSPSTRNYVIKFIVRYMFVLTGLVIVATFSNTVFDKLTEIAELTAKLDRMSVTAASPGAPIVPDQTQDLANSLIILSSRFRPPPGLDEAIAQLKAGNTKPAKEIQKYLLAQQTENVARAATLRRIGLLDFFNDTAASLAAYRQSVELDPTSWEAWGQIAVLLERTGDHEGATAAADKVLQIGKEKQDQNALGVGYGVLGYIEANAGRKDKARPLLEKSRGNFLAAESKLEYAVATNNLARLEFSEGNVEDAIRYYEEALATDTAINNQRGLASDYSGLAEIYFESEDASHYDKALGYYEKSVAANESIDDPHQAAMALSGKCNIYLDRRELGDLEKAKEACNKALALEQKIQNVSPQVFIMGKLAEVARAGGDFAGAEAKYREAIDIAQKFKLAFLEASINRGIGTLYLDEKKLVPALDAFRRAAEIDKSLNQQLWLARDQSWVGVAYEALGQRKEACDSWSVAADIYRDANAEDDLAEVVQKRTAASCT